MIRVFDAHSGEQTRNLEGHVKDVQFLSLAANGKMFGSTSFDHTARRWDLKNWDSAISFQSTDPFGPVVLWKSVT